MARNKKEKGIIHGVAGGADGNVMGIEDLLGRLRFSPKEGRIWLDDQRMILVHLTVMSEMRRKLIDALGFKAARMLLIQMGYTSGALDAAISRRVRSQSSEANGLLAGPQLHALEGVGSVTPLKLEMDIAKGYFSGDVIWEDSAEVDAHMAVYGLSADPVCWNQVGHASGFLTAYMGRQVLFREVECRAMGAPRCRVIGKPAEEWGDELGDDAHFFEPKIAPPRPVAIRSTRQADSDKAEGRGAGLVGVSSGFLGVCHMLEKVAGTSATVLLLGETGVGKGMFARMLHKMSRRTDNEFVAVNCAAIPDNLVESELFGVEKGAFTGAIASRLGRFERAEGGTLFLDEVGTLNLPAQGKLLRALQEKEIERVGDTKTRHVDVRLIAATNEDLELAVKERRFREDLLFRINVFPIRIPPLRERKDDIPVLMDHFLKKFTALHERNVTGFTQRAIDALLQYNYPGNIRELENIIERGVILAEDGAALDVSHLFTHAQSFLSEFLRMDEDGMMKGSASLSSMVEPLAEKMFGEGLDLQAVDAALVDLAVKRSKGNLAQAARWLGMSRAQVAYRLKAARGG